MALAAIGSALLDFYPRPPRGGRRAAIPEYYWRKLISIHALREEGDSLAELQSIMMRAISIHALREEGDVVVVVVGSVEMLFLSTPSARRATDRCF